MHPAYVASCIAESALLDQPVRLTLPTVKYGWERQDSLKALSGARGAPNDAH